MKRSGEGWILFAGIVLIVGGIMRFFDALWAFSYHGTLPQGLEGAIFGTSLTTYGWIDLGVATLLVLSGLGVWMGSQAARWFGVFAAALAGISAMWWMPYYPVWSLSYVAIGVLTIYALVVYGGDAIAD
jgi:hypothetical protein